MIEDLLVFTTVVEQSSLNKASKLLNLSQPALSRKIAKLEEEWGVSLFSRKGKRLELTRVGHEAYIYALEQRQRHQNFLQSVSRFKASERSVVTLGASLTTIQTTLPPLVTALMNKFPEIELKLVTGKTHEIVSYVRDRKVDIGVVASSISETGLRCIPLFQDHLELVVPRGHELAGNRRAAMEDLNGRPMIIFSKGTWYRKLIDDLFGRYGIIPDIRMEIDSFEAIVRLLTTCKAAALLPKSYLRKQLLKDNDLVAVPMKELEQTRRETCLVYGDKSELSKETMEWFTGIKESLAEVLSQ
ncbi:MULTISPECIES: LysR family transcriptional regulator [Paenibacillus]|uniref:LysR family transcriptional regulator n=1 Tax=Paenibacillus vini TaxID=1476024 RepID=A0ABQ4MFQ5_9BACL|nr:MULTISPECIES: LysR family transcriptional regulator [Paenibacillus]MBQ4900714.1 LysR family transcriptional regulator [Paenibacillus sp. Marseille-P2973]MDN4067956.1 LysR family transcriptional regulator [Paenibacillus vini]GIP54788.1 LysR family transcriptional regulator [Paenibacillus vini]